jgi:hypothetical protein
VHAHVALVRNCYQRRTADKEHFRGFDRSHYGSNNPTVVVVVVRLLVVIVLVSVLVDVTVIVSGCTISCELVKVTVVSLCVTKTELPETDRIPTVEEPTQRSPLCWFSSTR